jgi:Protein of unknown function (DUF2442)
MYWDVTSVKPIEYLTLKVTFIDGLEGTVHFKPSHLTGVFESLKDKSYFNKVYVSHGVVTWPGELDLAPDAMHSEIKKNGSWILE